jgi:hypothetical protein
MIITKKGFPFTTGCWTEHKKIDGHSLKLRSHQKSMLEAKEKSGTITRQSEQN